MKYSLRTKLTAAFLAVTLILFSLISLFTNFLLENQFKDYVIAQQAMKNSSFVESILEQYVETDPVRRAQILETIGVNALREGVMLRVMDRDGIVLWDAMVHNSGMCANILQNMALMMESRDADFKGGYEETIYNLEGEDTELGSVAAGYYGPYAYSANDVEFLDKLNRFMQIAAGISAGIAILLGLLLARQLSTPIKRVTKVAQLISSGHYEESIREKSSTTEIMDLTETINNLGETLSKHELLRKRLTADVAHELRTPLATLQGQLEAMIDGVWEADKARLLSCHEETQRLSKIVNSLEELTRYESENLILHRTTFDLTELAMSVTKHFEPLLMEKNLTLHVNGSSEYMKGDLDKIKQILVNLLANAVKFSREGDTIYVEASHDESHTILRISDTGAGIPEEDLPYIFERFFRADKSRNLNTGGSGIGLAIVKSLVEAHHGQILAESQLGKGTSFTLRFPKEAG